MEFAKPLPEHEWLQQMVGEWAYEGEAFMGPDKPAEKLSGTESVRSIGGLFVIAEMRGKTPGGSPCTMVATLGYDADQKRYVGTWLGSMMTRLWVYECSRDGDTLHLDSDGPSWEDPAKTARYRDAVEIKSRDERSFWSAIRQPDGSWQRFMSMRFRRVK
jgi:hypothetical protein